MIPTRRGQIEMTFNWVYILIAGAIILLFFGGLVIRQQAASEQRLTADVVETMQRIFTAAGVSEKTKNFIDTSGLVAYTFYFDCDDGVGEYGIEGGAVRAQVSHEPLFAPATLRTAQIITWSLPYEFPFKVIDFLFVTSPNSQYYLIGEGGGFAREFLNATEGINTGPSSVAKPILRREQYDAIDPGENYQVRLVDLDGVSVLQWGVPHSLVPLEDDRVTAIVFTGTHQVEYYVKRGAAWERFLSELSGSVPIYSLTSERDAAKYAAVFAAGPEEYECNMQKAFRRLGYIAQIYEGKARDLDLYYTSQPILAHTTFCQSTIQRELLPSLGALRQSVALCQRLPDSCDALLEPVQQLRDANEALRREGCITLY